MYWGSVEMSQQASAALAALSSDCAAAAAPTFPCTALIELESQLRDRSTIVLALQAVYLILLAAGALFLVVKSREILVQRTHTALALTQLRPAAENRDEVQRLVDAVSILSARQTGMEAEGKWQQKMSADHLKRNHDQLHALHEVARMFADTDVSEMSLRNGLALLEGMLGSRTVALCLNEAARQALSTAAILATHGYPAFTERLETEHGMREVSARIIPPHAQCKAFSLLVPVCRADVDVGTLIIEFPVGTAIEYPNISLAECFAHLAALAISSLSRSQEERRVALLEERNAIAGELHDSLAQSLAFMKIQVAQLQRGLERSSQSAEVAQAAHELREGLSTAYREVRELIAAFRVCMGPEGLLVTIRDTIEEFSQRGALDIHFHHDLGRCQLEVNEEFHVMQVIREALSNVVRHASASNVWVELRYDPLHALTVSVEDDGLGVGEVRPSTQQHYGLSIMSGRARSLGGKLAVYPRAGGGTRVELNFPPQRVPMNEAVEESE